MSAKKRIEIRIIINRGLGVLLVLLIGLASQHSVFSQAKLRLTVSNETELSLTLEGAIGSSYEIQFKDELATATEWQALITFNLETSASETTTIDQTVRSRYFRAVESNPGSNEELAPHQLRSGQMIQFEGELVENLPFQRLLINGPNSGVFFRPLSEAPTGIGVVILDYQHIEDSRSQLTVQFPKNSAPVFEGVGVEDYQLNFDSNIGGEFQARRDTSAFNVGKFTVADSLIDRSAMLDQAEGNLVFRLIPNIDGISSEKAVVFNSARAGFIFTEGDFDGRVDDVTLGYQRVGDFAANMTVTFPSSEFVSAQVEEYFLIYTSHQDGLYQVERDGRPIEQGVFQLDRSLVGLTATPESLEIHSSFSFAFRGDPMGDTIDRLVVDSAFSGTFVIGSGPDAGPRDVTLSYGRIGDLIARLAVTFPGGEFSQERVEDYTLVYTSLQGGVVEVGRDTFMRQIGVFTVDQTLMGLSAAPEVLEANASFAFTINDGPIGGTTDTLVVRSDDSGLFMASGGPESRIEEVTLDYRRLGELRGCITVTFPAREFSPARVEAYHLTYTSLHGGVVEVERNGFLGAAGKFTFDGSLVGSSGAPLNLQPNVSFLFTANDSPIGNVAESLIIDTPSSGFFFVDNGPDPGFSDVTVGYRRLGDTNAKMTVTFPASEASSARAEEWLLIFTSPHSGVYHRAGPEGFMGQTGNFTFDQSSVGLNPAPEELPPHLIYAFRHTGLNEGEARLILHDQNSASLLTPGGGAIPGRLDAPTIGYARHSSLIGELTVLIPENELSPARIEKYFLVYSSSASGVFCLEGGGIKTAGYFTTDASLVGDSASPDQLENNAAILSKEDGVTPIESEDRLFIDATNAGLLAINAGQPEGGIKVVTANYTRLGDLTAVISLDAGLAAWDYFLVFTSGSDGVFRFIHSDHSPRVGLFELRYAD